MGEFIAAYLLFFLLIISAANVLLAITNQYLCAITRDNYFTYLKFSLFPGLAVLQVELLIIAALYELNLISFIVLLVVNLCSLIKLRKSLTLKELKFRTDLFFGILILLFIFISQSLFTLRPNENVDVAVFHFPLLKSIYENGFNFPQIAHPFYGTIPTGNHLWSTISFSVIDSPVALNITNLVIFWIFLLLVLSIIKGPFLIKALILVFILFSTGYFTNSPTDGMQDSIRSCLTVASILYLYKYFQSKNDFFLLASGLTFGLAISVKMSELLLIIWIILFFALHAIFTKQKTYNFRTLLLVAAPTFFVSAFWYGRNFIYTGNPVYPFLFSHEGLTNEWMSEYNRHLSIPFEISDREYRRDISSIFSWQDFIDAFWKYFLSSVELKIIFFAVVLSLFKSFLLRSLVILNVVMFIIWYFFMFNHVRWALPAFLLSCVIAIIFYTDLANLIILKYRKNLHFTKHKFYFLILFFISSTIFFLNDINKTFLPVLSKFNKDFVLVKQQATDLFKYKSDSIYYNSVKNFELMQYIDLRNIPIVYFKSLSSPNEFYALYANDDRSPFVEFQLSQIQNLRSGYASVTSSDFPLLRRMLLQDKFNVHVEKKFTDGVLLLFFYK